MDDKLTGANYATMPVVELARHPDYSRHASRVMAMIMKMNSQELEELGDAVLAIRDKKNWRQ